MIRRTGKIVLLAALVALLAAGLAVQPTQAQTPKKGGTLVMAQNADIRGFDLHTLTDFPSFRALGLIYEPLVTFDKDLKYVPALAESWKFSDDGLTLTVNLRKGVKFHSGDAFTSADVKWTIARIQDEKTKAGGRSNFVDVDKVETPDESTAVFKLKQANVSILTALANPNAVMYSAKSEGKDMLDKANANGTGPFKFEAWEPGQRLVLAANKDYWQKDLPYLDKVEIRVIPQESSILAGLRSGDINFAVLNDPSVVVNIKAGSGITLMKAPALAYHVLQLNAARKPFDNLKVRQAINCAIDRQQVVDTALLGEGQITGPITVPAYRQPLDQLACYKQDVNKAKQLLEGAGKVEFTIMVAAEEPPTAVNEAQNVADQLAKVGITAKIEKLALDAYVKRWLAADFDSNIALNGGNPDPHIMFVRYWTSKGSLAKVAGFSDPKLDELMAAGQKETDQAKRFKIYQDLEKYLVEQAPWVWLYVSYEYRAMQDAVKGYIVTSLNSIYYLRQTWIDK